MAVANPGRLWKIVAHCGIALLLQAAVQPAPGENTETAGEKPAETLRAELLAQRPLYRPDGPLRLRFTILNSSDQPVEIPLDQPLSVNEGITLPLQVVLGSGSQRALTVFFEDEEGKTVAPPAPAASGDGPRVLRLGPHGSVGTDIDLRAYVQSTRYAGSYRLEWRPLEGRLGTVSAQFRVEPRKEAILVTDYGKVTFALDYDGAPRNVENFVELAGQGFYDGKTFHRVIPGYLAQGGCPKGDGTGIRADGKLLPAELRDLPVDIGTLLMAHKPSDVNSASCQFFIALARRPEWDNKYTVVGQARDEDSLRTLQQLAAQPTDRRDRPTSPLVIRSIKLVDAEQEQVRSLEYRAGRPTLAKPDAKGSARDHE